MKLYSPKEYEQVNAVVKNSICKGCGPGTGWKEAIVPDSILGVNINEACNIHDFMYSDKYHEMKGIKKSAESKKNADCVFLGNMTTLIMNKPSWKWVKRLRLKIAHKYYQAVKHFGGPSFYQ